MSVVPSSRPLSIPLCVVCICRYQVWDGQRRMANDTVTYVVEQRRSLSVWLSLLHTCDGSSNLRAAGIQVSRGQAHL